MQIHGAEQKERKRNSNIDKYKVIVTVTGSNTDGRLYKARKYGHWD